MGVAIRLTDEEFLNLSDEPGKQELLDGELISLPPAKLRHNIISKRLFQLLSNITDPSRVFYETGYRLRRGRWLQPDLSVNWPDQPSSDWLERSPQIAIEIASRGNTPEQIERKAAAYLADGSAEVWISYPEQHGMTVCKRDGVRETATGVYQSAALNASIDIPALLA